MAQNKLENQFKEKLNQREITPSPIAWDRLDAMLTVAEESNTKRKSNWLYVAASFLGFVLIGGIYLSQTQELIDSKHNEVVIQNSSKKDTITNERPVNMPSKANQEVVLELSHEVVHPKDKTSQVNTKTKPLLEETTIASQSIASQSIINQKTEQIKPVEVKLPSSEGSVANQEVTSSKENAAAVKVNPSNLLSLVDQELDLSFREKVIRKIDKNFKTVKVALANRNQQSINNQN